MLRRARFALFIALPFALATTGLVTFAQRAATAPRRPGLLGQGVMQLPNGWRIAPAGRHAPIGDLPLNMIWSPDGRYLIVTNNGWSKPTLTIFDAANLHQIHRDGGSRLLGLAWDKDGKRLYSSGAAQNQVRVRVERPGAEGGTLLVVAAPALRPTFETLASSGFSAASRSRRTGGGSSPPRSSAPPCR